MQKIDLLLFLTITILINSCTKDVADMRLSNFDTPIIEGFCFRDFDANVVRTIGNPNVKLGNGSDISNSTYFFSVFPNPCEGSLYVNIKKPSGHRLVQMWITPANYGNQSSNEFINTNNMNTMTVGGIPLIQIESNHADVLVVDLSGFSNGYYRIYLKVDEYLLYDNLVIYKPKE